MVEQLRDYSSFNLINVSKEDIEYLAHYMTIDETIINKINTHCKRYDTYTICAWYEDLEDFFSDWCGIGYTRTEARKIYYGGQGEFQTFPNGNIIRYVI